MARAHGDIAPTHIYSYSHIFESDRSKNLIIQHGRFSFHKYIWYLCIYWKIVSVRFVSEDCINMSKWHCYSEYFFHSFSLKNFDRYIVAVSSLTFIANRAVWHETTHSHSSRNEQCDDKLCNYYSKYSAFASIIIIKPPPSMSYKQINRRLSLIVTMASIITEFCSRKFAYSPW